MVAVNLDNVYKYYGNKTDANEIPAVDNLNLSVKDGEFVAILGPSGCGKSTTMRMIAGLEHISSGSIKFGDKVVNSLAPKDRDIAMVFENYALYPHKTVFDNVANPLKLEYLTKFELRRKTNERTFKPVFIYSITTKGFHSSFWCQTMFFKKSVALEGLSESVCALLL